MVQALFKTAKEEKILGYPLGTLLRRKSVKGDIGLEIEVEGNKFQKEGLPPPWVYHKDGSLRGKDNAEYVLSKPALFDEIPVHLASLWGMFKEFGSKLDDSNRTSVHVHLNFQNFHMNRLTAFSAMYFAIEELLTAWCGEHRVGNLFCLRAKDAPAIVTHLKKFIQTDGNFELRDGLHYAGFNVQALQKFGSVEIRTLRGAQEPQLILDWVGILRRLYDFSGEFPDPRLLVDSFSGNGPIQFLEMILGEHVHVLRNGINYNQDQIREAMYDGIRLAQDLCYCRDWSLFNPIEIKNDPFGRDMKKVMSNLSSTSFDLDTLQTFAEPPVEYDELDIEEEDEFDNEYPQQGTEVQIEPIPTGSTGSQAIHTLAAGSPEWWAALGGIQNPPTAPSPETQTTPSCGVPGCTVCG